jgi:HemK-related putative methylase
MYEPQEDSLMLKDAIETFLKKNKQDTCIDMGTGTGFQGEIMSHYCTRVICTDINPEAISFVKDTLKKENKDKFEVIQSDLFENINSSLKGKVGLIAFNPPYLPREEDEEEDDELTSGTSGMDVTLRFIKESKPFLKKRGRLFFVVSSHSDVKLVNSILEKEGFRFEVIKKEHFFFEDIMIYEAWMDDRNK